MNTKELDTWEYARKNAKPQSPIIWVQDGNLIIHRGRSYSMRRLIEGKPVVVHLEHGSVFSDFEKEKDLAVAERDALIMALRLHGEGEATFSPEMQAVMARWRPKCRHAISRGDVLNDIK